MSELCAFVVDQAQIKKVRAKLPVPTICPNCGSAVELVNNSIVYGKEQGRWPFVYRCVALACNSHVGLHPFTDIPLGTLADHQTRVARTEAKAVFKPMWEQYGMDRNAAYRWLGDKMGIAEVRHVHIGWFSLEQCQRVIEICSAMKSNQKRGSK